MAYWKRCPECGETNYFESGYAQQFDCGFKGWNAGNERQRRCGGKKKSSIADAATKPVSDDISRYRLALLDAARVADVIAADLASGTPADECAARLKALAEQMRAFAGHGNEAPQRSFDDYATSASSTGNALTRWVRRVKVW